MLSLVDLIISYKNNLIRLKNKKLLSIIPLGMILVISSYLCAHKVGYSLSMRSLVQTSLVVLPALYVFIIANIFDENSIINLMKFTLIATIITYFTEPTHTISQFFILDNWTTMSFSNSFLESSICAGTFLQLYLFFNYYCDIEGKKELRIYKIAAFIFNLMSMKRLGMLFAFFMLVFTKFNYSKRSISKKAYLLIPLIFTAFTIFYTCFVKGDIDLFGIDAYKLTTGRTYILSLWRNKNYFSYGFGTAMLVINRYLEMDLVEIYLEMGAIVTFIFC